MQGRERWAAVRLVVGGLVVLTALVVTIIQGLRERPERVPVPTRTVPTRTVPTLPGRPARPGHLPGELAWASGRPVPVAAAWWQDPGERITLPPAEQRPRLATGGLYVLPESILADFAAFVRFFGELVGLIRESKAEIVVVLENHAGQLFSAAWWSIFALGGVVTSWAVMLLVGIGAAVSWLVRGPPR